MRRGLEVRERVLGPDHADVGYALVMLGWLLRERGDETSALATYERAVDIAEQHREDGSQFLALGHLGLLRLHRREFDHAYEHLSLAVQAHDISALPLSGFAVQVLDGLADAEIALGKLDDAGAHLRRVDGVLPGFGLETQLAAAHADAAARLVDARRSARIE
jgi:tetratricopeptide (TPR) repeat protein